MASEAEARPKKRAKVSHSGVNEDAAADTSELPLLLPAESKRKTILVQLDNRKMNLQGEAGTIGRLRVGKDKRIVLDLNGSKLQGSLYPSVTSIVVQIGKEDAKVTSVVNEVCIVTSQVNELLRLKGQANEGDLP